MVQVSMDMVRYEFDVEGMCCESCEATISRAAREIDGVTGVKANSDTGSVKVIVDETPQDRVRDSIEDAGFTVVG